jgi:molybdopterin-guanine dinucleotide biosynthesis protein
MENVMSSAESGLEPGDKIELRHAAGVVQPADSESKEGPNTSTASHAESLLAAEKRTLQMIADGASLKKILNDLCSSIDVEASPVISTVGIDHTKNVVFIGIISRQRTEAQKTTLYTKLVEELKACGIEQNDIVVSIVTNSDADWSFGNGPAQFLTGEL